MNSQKKAMFMLGAALMASSVVVSGDILPFVAAAILALKAAQLSFAYEPTPAAIPCQGRTQKTQNFRK